MSTVFRVEKTKGFTVMSNYHLRDKSLTLKAKGLLSVMLSLPDGWEFTLKGLASMSDDGLDSVRAAVHLLEKQGYLIRKQLMDDKGHFTRNEYTVYEKPTSEELSTEKPLSENPITEKPSTENPTQINKEELITEKQNTEYSKYPSINQETEGAMAERAQYEEGIKENLQYDILKNDPHTDRMRLEEIIGIMLDVVSSKRATIRINGEDMPTEIVRKRFLQIDATHIQYIFDVMKEQSPDIRNIRAFLITALYNAPVTMENYYWALAQSDTLT